MKLYTTVEAVPSRILGVANVLQALAGRTHTRAEIIDLIQPPALRRGVDNDPDMSNKVIAAARELGVLEEYENDQGEPALRLAPGAAVPPGQPVRPHWERWISRRILHDLVDHEASHLATIFAWLMTLRLKNVPSDRAAWKDRFVRDGFDLEQFGLRNDARWDNVFDWARFTGLCWQTRSSRDTPGLICDPSILLSRFLGEVLPDAPEVTAEEFRARLGAVFPVLDGGRVYHAVHQRVGAARAETPDQADRLSPGVSMAVRELRDRGLVTYHCPDDQRTFLLFDDGERIAFISRARDRVI